MLFSLGARHRPLLPDFREHPALSERHHYILFGRKTRRTCFISVSAILPLEVLIA
jgi:hypothetical protein